MDVFVEILLTIFGDVIVALLSSIFDGRRPSSPDKQLARLFGFLIIGLVAGWVSVLIFPAHFLTNPTAQIVWLAVSPLTAAFGVYLFHLLFFPRDDRGWPMVHAATLSATIAMWRYLAL
ncbi:MAG: hypothetical protein Q8L48_43715 [Archangium sp.]|nr:hypothetical protein [Archangium sp.]